MTMRWGVLFVSLLVFAGCKSSENSAPDEANFGVEIRTANPPGNPNASGPDDDEDPPEPKEPPPEPPQIGDRAVAITIDDMPFLQRAGMSQIEEKEGFLQVLDAFQRYQVTAEGFANGGYMAAHENEFMDLFISRGHNLHSHTYSHVDLNQVAIEVYKTDITDNEETLAPWLSSPKFFRYPYLAMGDTAEKKQAIKGFLRERGYTIAPVTFDSGDWWFNGEYNKAFAENDRQKMAEIGKQYVEYVKRQTEVYERFAADKVGRPIRHILLVHMNPLNVEYLDDVLDYYQKNDWQFITMEQAIEDPIYRMQDNHIGPGITWLQRLYGDPPDAGPGVGQ